VLRLVLRFSHQRKHLHPARVEGRLHLQRHRHNVPQLGRAGCELHIPVDEPLQRHRPCYRWFSLNPNQYAQWNGWGGSAGRVILTIELVNGTVPGETSRTIYVRPELDTNLLCQ